MHRPEKHTPADGKAGKKRQRAASLFSPSVSGEAVAEGSAVDDNARAGTGGSLRLGERGVSSRMGDDMEDVVVP